MLDTRKVWPPDYESEIIRRKKLLALIRKDPIQLDICKLIYKNGAEGCIRFISDWGMLVEPREAFSADAPPLIPFIFFKRQEEMVQFIIECLFGGGRGLVEKSRDVGATWICVWISIWLWLYYPSVAVGWGSQNSEQVDNLGDPSSIFEKIRMGIRSLPMDFRPAGFDPDKHMMSRRIVNPQNKASIIGGIGDSIGRGGRTLVTFKDEAAHLEHPEKIEAALSYNCKVQIDISSVHGVGTVFHRRREAGIEWSPGCTIAPGYTRVFVLDWRDHPAKTQAWYDLERAKFAREGLLHVFAQEVDRDYSAAVEGVIIPMLWIKAAENAHLKLDFPDDGPYSAGLDIADEGGDLNALVTCRGPIVKTAEQWGERDTGVTTRRAIATCQPCGRIDLQYDASGGYGSGVKAEYNRLKDDFQMPKGIKLVPWLAGGEVQDKDRHVIPGDKNSPTNGELFDNFKAQAWWALRRRFEITYRALTEPEFTYDTDDCISIPSDLPLKATLMKELAQPVMTQSTRLRMKIDKKPEGTKSPNLADALVMCCFPNKAKSLFKFTSKILNQPGRWAQGRRHA